MLDTKMLWKQNNYFLNSYDLFLNFFQVLLFIGDFPDENRLKKAFTKQYIN